MKRKKQVKPPNKFLIKTAMFFYGNGFLKRKIKLVGGDILKTMSPPFLLLASHSGGISDVLCVTKLLQDNPANFVASKTQFAVWGNLLKKVGAIEKTQFKNQPSVIRDIKHILSSGHSVAIYPEAKISVDGTQNYFDDSTARLAKMLNVPVVTLCLHGSYLSKPRWAKNRRFAPVQAEVEVVADQKEIAQISKEELYQKIVANLTYDDYKYQLENNIEIEDKKLVEGLENILFVCPECQEFHKMTAKGDALWCKNCGFGVKMDKFGVFALNNETRKSQSANLDSVKEWYRFQHKVVQEQIVAGKYDVEVDCTVELQIKNKFKKIKGEAKFKHNQKEMSLALPNGEKIIFSQKQFFTLSFNNDFVFLPTDAGVYRLRFDKVGLPTLLNIAVEEMAVLDGRRPKYC